MAPPVGAITGDSEGENNMGAGARAGAALLKKKKGNKEEPKKGIAQKVKDAIKGDKEDK